MSNKLDSSVTNISPQEFVALSNPPLLIDVRSNLEYKSGHAPNAVNLSLPRVLMGNIPLLRQWMWPEWFQNLSPEREIAIICFTAHRSPIVAKQLAKWGFERVYNVTGGMVEWKKLGFETRKGNEPTPATSV